MTATVERLLSTQDALLRALEMQDWQAIGRLDQQCRQAVEQVLLPSDADRARLVGCVENLLELYRQLIGVCQQQQKQAADEMCQVQRSRKGAQVYQMLG